MYGRAANALVDVLRTTNLMFGAVLVGGMIMEFMLILPTQRQIRLDAARAFRIMSPIAWRDLPVCGASSVISAIALLVVWHWHSFTAAVIGLTIAGSRASYRRWRRTSPCIRQLTGPPAPGRPRAEKRDFTASWHACRSCT